MLWLCITSVLSVTAVVSGQTVDTSHIRVFPAVNQSVAGVFQVSSLDHLNQPQYAFNASEARTLCSSLRVNMASKADVQRALSRGLETCRFGWVDEHFAVVPRINPLSNCGQSQTGLVMWRAPVTQKFDVFCFNESDAATQLEDTTTDSPVSSSDYTADTTHSASSSSSSSSSPSSSSAPEVIDNEVDAARFIGGVYGSAGGKVVLITCTCALLLLAIIIIVYLKLRSRSRSSDLKQQQEFVETEEWTCVKNIKETEEDAQEDERIQVDDNAS